MFSLTPWKKRQTSLPIQREESRMDVWEPLARFREEFDALMEDFFGGRFGELSRFVGWEPGRPGQWDFGWEEKDDEYLLTAEIPGFEPEEIDVKLSGNVLTVRASHKEEKSDKESATYRYGEFYRTITLPSGVDTDKIDARYHSGVLEVHVPKSEEFQGRRIEVKQA
ncbi:MAG TPA: Hsp20/alpha crystallin family protein [Planctomycetaceae bacterium]|nr:Hsp20/alpha crystallin family protein [Planctomycetaceae bacterium]